MTSVATQAGGYQMAGQWTVKIDQSAMQGFPRPASWWENYLPLWFFERTWWMKDRNQWQQDVVLSADQSQVSVMVDDRAHASQCLEWLGSRSALREFPFSFWAEKQSEVLPDTTDLPTE